MKATLVVPILAGLCAAAPLNEGRLKPDIVARDYPTATMAYPSYPTGYSPQPPNGNGYPTSPAKAKRGDLREFAFLGYPSVPSLSAPSSGGGYATAPWSMGTAPPMSEPTLPPQPGRPIPPTSIGNPAGPGTVSYY